MNVDVSAACSRPASPPTIRPSSSFRILWSTKSLVSLFDFENRSGFFPDVDSRMKFCLFTAGSGAQPAADHAEFAFFAHAVEELRDPERRFTLSPEDISLLNPNTLTCPTFRSRRDAELAKAIYRRVPVLIREARDGEPKGNPWGIRLSIECSTCPTTRISSVRESNSKPTAGSWRETCFERMRWSTCHCTRGALDTNLITASHLNPEAICESSHKLRGMIQMRSLSRSIG